ncbi:uncharacterized protein PGTG_09971 [Puccinia graminis f. sp. tritici CRL 75-36-700-3]|uniref:Tet-like 2OG-Fe(II) oxygenase domain-containing protein n=1 Tax=Puccinia graminis f. sp. tritici (strain CRL 75-36-700-3 / race SCCL) TaxID=418459 RepID=E3KFH6_PUCGT|nr:uncharacterized protein PGTG_09971 [Puccinia graminis f. sp. tritici CRL 75-36-700-3]EFP83003.1 hypothetical protein PGTG_09971 [Puccinia graminis f. sp. tritici CRL 75-36-700-3]
MSNLPTYGFIILDLGQQIVRRNQKNKNGKKRKFKADAELAEFTTNLHPETATMRREHIKLDLYPNYPPLDDTNAGQRATHPTPADFKAAEERILKDFTLITYGRLALYERPRKSTPNTKREEYCIPVKNSVVTNESTELDQPNNESTEQDQPKNESTEPDQPENESTKPDQPKKPKCAFIAYIQFTPSEELTEEDKHDLNSITTFLHNSRGFVKPVNLLRKIFRGRMWTIGWRKSQTTGEMAGRYVDTDGITKKPLAYLENLINGISASDLIHKLFYSISDAAVDAANVLLTSLGLPGYCDPNLKRSTSNCFASNLAFTRDEFSNRPHCDSDKTKTAFLLLSNVNKANGLIALTSHQDPTFTGPFFVFPHHRVAIDLRKLNGICRVVFDAVVLAA